MQPLSLNTRRSPRRGRSLAIALTLAGLLAGAAGAQQGAPFDAGAKARFAASVSAEARPYLVDLGPRWILPDLERRVRFTADRAEVYLQFQRALSADERTALMREGVRFDGAIAAHTYRARIRPEHVAPLRRHPLLRGVEQVLPTDKLSPGVHAWSPGDQHLGPDGSAEVLVRFHDDVGLGHALRVLERWDVPLADADGFRILKRLRAVATRGQALVLAEEPAVRELCEPPRAGQDANVSAAIISNVDEVQGPPWDLTGAGLRIGQWEEFNPLATHPELDGRVTIVQDAGPGDHATHVAGTMIGDGSNVPGARGMATEAEIFAYDLLGDIAVEMANALLDDQVFIDNHSWTRVLGWDDGVDTGSPEQFGNYDPEAAAFDLVIREFAMFVQTSAGDDRDDCDPTDATVCDGVLRGDGEWYDTIPTFGNAKNLITVGAVDDATGLAGFSSSGPSDDGRIKPDLVANGTTLLSTWAGGLTLDDCPVGASHCGLSGTSSSAAVVSGTVALMAQLHFDRYGALIGPQAMKALLVNTARDLGRPGPDYLYGHGLLDALAAAQTILASEVRILTGAIDQGETETWYLEVGPYLPELRVTLAWTDFPGPANTSDPDLINDLAVEVESPDGTLHYPFRAEPTAPTLDATATGPNPVDNVEHVRLATPSSGLYTVRVRGGSVPEGPQIYSLVANQSFRLDEEPNIEVSGITGFPATCVGDSSISTFTIYNTGGVDLVVHGVSAETYPAFRVDPLPSPPFVLAPGTSIEINVIFAPTTEAIFLGTLTIESNDADEGLLEIPLLGVGSDSRITAHMESKGYFGPVPLGQLETLDLQLLNNGVCALQVTSLEPTFGGPEFTVGEVLDLPGFPFTLYPGESADIYLRYRPTDYGNDIGMFTLLSTATDNPRVTIAVSGYSPPPDIAVTGSLDFGEICAGEPAEATIDVCNTGVSDLEVTSVSLGGDCADFMLVNNPFPATVSHDFCLPVTVRYVPSGAGSHECTLEIESNDPDEPLLTLPVTGAIRAVSLDVAPDLAFPPTVVQDIAPCQSALPFPITNNGDCPVTVTGIGVVGVGGYYEVQNLPAFPVTLLPGEQLGDGLLTVTFAPGVVERYSTAAIDVTWLTDLPTAGDKETATRLLCGEGVRTGMRVLVTLDGVPMPQVDRVKLFEIFYPGTTQETHGFVQLDTDVPLSTTEDQPPCVGVPYHVEYGGQTNPITLDPGTYDVWIEHYLPGTGWRIETERIVVPADCSFLPDVEIEL